MHIGLWKTFYEIARIFKSIHNLSAKLYAIQTLIY